MSWKSGDLLDRYGQLDRHKRVWNDIIVKVVGISLLSSREKFVQISSFFSFFHFRVLFLLRLSVFYNNQVTELVKGVGTP